MVVRAQGKNRTPTYPWSSNFKSSKTNSWRSRLPHLYWNGDWTCSPKMQSHTLSRMFWKTARIIHPEMSQMQTMDWCRSTNFRLAGHQLVGFYSEEIFGSISGCWRANQIWSTPGSNSYSQRTSRAVFPPNSLCPAKLDKQPRCLNCICLFWRHGPVTWSGKYKTIIHLPNTETAMIMNVVAR